MKQTINASILEYPHTLTALKEGLIKTAKSYIKAEDFQVMRHENNYYVTAWISSPVYRNYFITIGMDKKQANKVKKELKGVL